MNLSPPSSLALVSKVLRFKCTSATEQRKAAPVHHPHGIAASCPLRLSDGPSGLLCVCDRASPGTVEQS